MYTKRMEAVGIGERDPQFYGLAPCVGYLAGSSSRGDLLVEHDGYGPNPAKLVKGLCRSELIKEEFRGREVLLVFEKGDPNRPIIINFMADPPEGPLSLVISESQSVGVKEVYLDGSKITLEAQTEMILKCGLGSITIGKDGKIVIKGTHLVSRSKGVNKVRGATVRIN
ncbi:MAG TPA: DUF6484 domain-containing protein [Thermodesulfobacteriota bacterium]|nr:DUF6484 domain-containing protein [Thermodesulfobacteriota bacterium]